MSVLRVLSSKRRDGGWYVEVEIDGRRYSAWSMGTRYEAIQEAFYVARLLPVKS